MAGIKEGLFDLLAPRHCCVCYQPLPEKHGCFEVCGQCEDRLSPGDDPEVLLNRVLQHFTNDELALSAIFALYALYADNNDKEFHSSNIVHAIKYRHKKQMAMLCGKKMGEFIKRVAPVHYEIVIPVPLHRAKVRERGYNQSEFLALGIAEILHIPIFRQTVIRTRYTKSQTTKSARERVLNVKSVFRVRVPEQITSRRILLVDDVITTGSTLNACALALLEGGAKRVDAIVLTQA